MSSVTATPSWFMRRLPLPKDPFHRMILAIVLGIFIGLFFGESVAAFKIVGIAYVRLLQMTVLPYIVVAVVAGISRLNPDGAGALGLRAGTLIVFLWGVSWLTSFMIPLSYPTWSSGSFYSNPLPTETRTDLLGLFIPANIFESLANSVVPAVVVFSVALGLALMAMREKDVLLQTLEVLETALGRIMSYIVKFAPLGVFALAIAAAGTIQVEEFNRLQIYLWTFVAAAVFLGVVTLPLLVAMATPFSYSDVLRCARTAMITAFAVGTVLVVLPLIAEECKKLIAKFKLAGTETDSAVDVLAPTAYTLPTAGTPVSLAFILFVAWFNGESLGLDQYPAIAALGIPSSFGGMNLAIPFMLDFLRLPADYFGLFILGTVVTTNLWTALAAMHGVVLSLLAACAMAGRLNWLNLVLTGAASILLAAVLFWVVGFAFTGILPQENVGEQRLLAMQLTGEQVAVTEMADTAPLPVEARQRKRLAVIRERGRLRVGVNADRLPFVYRNDRGKLVGLDMELVHALARDLGVSLELVKVTWGDVREGLNSGRIDLAIGGIAITPKRALNTTFTRSYVDETPGFLIRDEVRDNFTDLEGITQLPSLKVGIMPNYFQRQIQRILPNAEFVVVDSLMPFLRGEAVGVDAIVISAQMGSAWTLIYPDFTAVVPDGMKVTVPVGFAMPDEQLEYLSYLNNWLGVNIKTGMVANLYRHWVLGKTILERPPRWSIIRDVLHWIE